MTWKEFTQKVATRAGVSESEARKILGAFVDEVEAQLVAGEGVRVPGLGSFKATWKAERQVRGIHDGRKIALDGHWWPGFSAATGLRDALRARTPQLLKDPEHQAAWRLAETLVGDLALYHQRAIPTDLDGDLGADGVDARCRGAFGSAWERARETWAKRTPAAVQQSRDYLALAAQRRFAGRD